MLDGSVILVSLLLPTHTKNESRGPASPSIRVAGLEEIDNPLAYFFTTPILSFSILSARRTATGPTLQPVWCTITRFNINVPGIFRTWAEQIPDCAPPHVAAKNALPGSSIFRAVVRNMLPIYSPCVLVSSQQHHVLLVFRGED